MPEGTVLWDAWPLTGQAVIDECADALYDAGFPTDVQRGHDPQGNEARSICIHLPGDPNRPLRAALGQVVVLLFGKPQVLTADQYAETFPEA